jgi:ribosomal protein L11 methylase PrmA
VSTNGDASSEKNPHAVRYWPALDIHPASESLQAALVDFEVSAIDERSADDWRVFFADSDERDKAAAALRTEFPALALRPVDVPDENWAARSQASLRAIHVGRCVVAPPWDVPGRPQNGSRPTADQAVPAGPQATVHPASDPSPDDLVIVIQPSMGFGTGHHATTRLCLEALQRLDLGGRTVIDVGTGSGVLAIAASLLGASRVVGLDDDPDAIASAQESLGLNAAAEVTLLVADLRSADLGPADIVMANLTGGLLIAAARTLQDLVARGGRLIVSGLMTDEESSVFAAFTPWHVEQRGQEDEWVCLTLKLG